MGFSDLIREARVREEYWIEDATLGFTVQLYALMREKGLSQADLAAKIGVSQPYVARILKESDNLTIAMMVKLVRAVGADMQIVIRETEVPLEVNEKPSDAGSKKEPKQPYRNPRKPRV